MSRDRSVEAFILKRQDFGEADQIITLFSKEEGKLRAVVKAAKLPTSKLQPMLQPLFQTRVNLTGRNSATSSTLGKVIGAQIIKAYSGILDSEAKLGVWYMAAELVIRALPDSQPNAELFADLEKYADFLHNHSLSADQAKHSITQFQIKSLASLGLGIREAKNPGLNLGFSLDHGGFTDKITVDAVSVPLSVQELFVNMKTGAYSADWPAAPETLQALHNAVNKFVTYQLEREIKSQRFLAKT